MVNMAKRAFIQTSRKPWTFSPRMNGSSEQTLRTFVRKPRVFNPRLFIIRARSSWLFTLSLIVILLSGFSILTKHQGGALKILPVAFFLLLMASFRYLIEIKKNEK